jgi:hypothetical protein
MSTQRRAIRSVINISKIEILLFFLLVFIYTYTFPRWADPNQNSRLNMVFAVVEDGTFRIDPYVGNTVDYAKVGDHYYSDKAPGAAFLGIPIYASMKVFLDLPVFSGVMEMLSNNAAFQATLREGGTGILVQKVRFALIQVVLSFLFSAIPTGLVGILLYRLAKQLTAQYWIRVCIVLIYGLLTPVLAYAGAYYGHQLSTALVFAAFYLAWRHADRFSVGKAILSGFLLSYSIITEYPVALLAGLIFMYLAYRLYQNGDLLKMGWVTGVGLVVGLGWMVYNNTVFGGPLELGYQYSELWVEQHGSGFMSLTSPHWEAIWGITFSPFRGLYFYSPVLLFALPGFFQWWRSRRSHGEFWVAFTCTCIVFLFNASSIMWWGGFAIGPRYMLPMLPFMALALVFGLQMASGSKTLMGLMLLMVGWSFLAIWGITLAGQAFPPDTIRNPLAEYALPAWQSDDVARNMGTILGLQGASSLIPLGIVSILLILLMLPAPFNGLKPSCFRENAKSKPYTH